ncbi:hypothetical protein L1887_51758 [Cichorium endivia]|nr:hypothetical protein L1887_51758 [Cichorium endivia]
MRLARPSSWLGRVSWHRRRHSTHKRSSSRGAARPAHGFRLELPLDMHESGDEPNSANNMGPVDRQASEDQEKRSTALPPGPFLMSCETRLPSLHEQMKLLRGRSARPPEPTGGAKGGGGLGPTG